MALIPMPSRQRQPVHSRAATLDGEHGARADPAPGLVVTGLDDPRWLDFAGSHPEATVFHHPAWSRMLVAAYGYRPAVLLQLDRSGAVAAGVPTLEVQRFSPRRRFTALPFTDYCPPLATGEDSLTELTSALVRWQRSGHVHEISVHAGVPAMAGVHVASRAVRHVLPLGCTRDEYLQRIKGNQVDRAIRKAQREGVTARIARTEADVDAFYQLHLQTRRRQGVPVQPRRFFRLLWKLVIEPGLGFVVLAQKDGQSIAGAVYLAWNDHLIYKYGASDARFWELRPNNLTMWTAIEWACEHGYRDLDFGRSDIDNSGLREFKRRWGAVEIPLDYSYVTATPVRPMPGLSRQVLARVIRLSPPVVCRLAGELLYGRLPGLAS
jgi:CelD/BcsL family acetyltransferase involved in cellulose biosynthesis